MTRSRQKKHTDARQVPRQQPTRGKYLFVVTLFVLLVVAVSTLWYMVRGIRIAPWNETGTAVQRDGSGDFSQAVFDLVRQRQELDQTIWRDEVLAQQYEDYFVRLWDKLRAASDKAGVLASEPFGQLVWGEPRETSRNDWGILVSHCDGAERQVDSAQWSQMLRALSDDGFRIIQTEWHHSDFDPGESGNASSTISTRLDVVKEVSQTRFSITGDIHVNWYPLSEADGTPRPRSIDARGLRITQRTGPVGFEQAYKIDDHQLGSPQDIPSVIAYDLDDNGLSELLVPSSNLLYYNRGGWQFDRQTLMAYPPDKTILASLAGDFNGDGRVDLLCATRNLPILYLADDRGKFAARGKVIDAVGQELGEPSVLTAGDIDADGDLDVWLAQYKQAYRVGQMPTPYYDANDGFPAFLLLNDGAGHFQNVTDSRGLEAKRHRRTYGGSFIDLDDDGDLDLAVASDYAGLDVYLNDGKGHFQDVTASFVDHRHSFGMALTFADYNLDQRIDFYMIGMSSTTARRLDRMGLGRDEFANHQRKRGLMGYGNRLYLAKENGFHQAPFNAQVARTGWSWGTTSFDFDNDADVDIYVANGHISNKTAKDYCTRFWCHDIYTGNSRHNPVVSQFFEQVQSIERLPISWNGFEHNCLLMNQSGTGFLRVAFLMGVAFEFDSRNVISDDFDGDGRRDLLVVGKDSEQAGVALYLLKNVWPPGHHWIGVCLREQGQGRSPLGARVRVAYDGGQQVSAIVAGDSLYSQHATTAHFGLGPTDSVEQIDVFWPDGSRSSLEHPAVDRYHEVEP